MFERVLRRGPKDLQRARPSGERLLGCCRDFTVFFVSMARHKGIPARPRVGYASYFRPGWLIDHVIAEVWTRGRWRLIEPEIGDEFARDADGGGFDPLDVPGSRFLPGPAAWRAARSGQLDPERFVVAPEVAEPYTRGWLSLRHHLVQDLASLTKTEMLLWDQWGILDRPDVLRDAGLLDQLALATGEPRRPLARLELWSSRDGLKVPRQVTSYSPAHPGPVAVDVGRTLGDAG
ncbi:MAG TPA: transglutaminase domain-containing protein [Candidatus Dormibacteraeota bacterium]|nr:transglutaminase domain-containing protein [Candidatus Dormibacteraeota bacterium]